MVDDGSTDGTWEELQVLGSRVRALRQQNAGPGAARNLGAQHATGDYLAFLDSDDLWFPWTLDIFHQVIAACGEPAMICGRSEQFHEERELAHVRPEPMHTETFPDYLASWRHQYSIGSGMVSIRRSAFLGVGGFSTMPVNMEDHDLTLRLGTATGFVHLNSPVTLAYRRHGGGVTGDSGKTYAGNLFLIQQEKQSKYSGGRAHARKRQHLICSHTRSTSLACLRAGRRGEAWRLYLETFAWQVRGGRWRYLAGMPLGGALVARSWPQAA